MDSVFNDTTGMFVTKEWDNGITYVNSKQKDWYTRLPKKYQSKYKKLGQEEWNKFVDTVDLDDPNISEGRWIYKKKGMQVLAIPGNDTIPEWALPYIDYSTMINNIISPFVPVLEIFKAKTISEGKSKNGRKTNRITNIVKF